MSFDWTDDLNTGIDEIDAQNQRLGDFINLLDEGVAAGDREKLGYVLEELLDFAVNNFLFEEKLMEEAGYEFHGAHERVHELFIKKLAEFRGRYASGDDVTGELRSMLVGWVDNHVKREDKDYVASVRKVSAEEGDETWVQGIMKKMFG
jgi:hemerythrin